MDLSLSVSVRVCVCVCIRRCTPHARALCRCIKDELTSVLMSGSPHVQGEDVRLVDGFDCD